MTDLQMSALSLYLTGGALVVVTLAFGFFTAAFISTRDIAAAESLELVTVGAPNTGGLVDPKAAATHVSSTNRSVLWANIGVSLSWLQTVLLVASVITRGLANHRWPLGNMYEFAVFGACAVSLGFSFLNSRTDITWLGSLIAGFVLVDLGAAIVMFIDKAGETAPLVPALKSYWLSIHVTAAVLSTGGFTLAAGASMAYLVVERANSDREQGKPETGFVHWAAKRLPSLERLDALAYRVHAFIFPLWTFAVIAGAIWARQAWDRYWGWDPKETWSFVIWVMYAAYMHARATAGWKGRKAAWLSVWGFATVLFNFFVVNIFFVGLHSYSGVGN